MARYDSVLDLIGNTPLVSLAPLTASDPSTAGVALWAKLEGQNPGGSVKDRIAKRMIEAAEADGVLAPGATVLEPSSGNTGIGLAIVCRLRGYPLRIVLPQNVSPERRQLLEAFGVDIVDSPGDEGSNGAIRLAEELAAKAEADGEPVVLLHQYRNAANPAAHYETTGPEILADCPEIDAFVAGLGTSGTLMGVGRYLKEHKPGVRVIAVEPPAGEQIQALRSLDDGYVPPIFDPDLLDRKSIVRPLESIEWTRRLAEDCGIFAGLSSGAAVAGAMRVATEMGTGTVVTLLPDAGWKYLSTGAWTEDLDVVVERAQRIIYF